MDAKNSPAYFDLVEGDHSADNKNDAGRELEFTRTVQKESNKTKSCEASLLIGFALFTAVLALLLAGVAIGFSTALKSNTETESLSKQLSYGQSTDLKSTVEIQSLRAAVNMLQLSLNQSIDTIEDLGHQIAAVGPQANTTTQNDNQALQQRVSQLEGLVNTINESLKATKLQLNENALDAETDSQAIKQSVAQLDFFIYHNATELMTNLEQVSQNQRVVYTRWGSSSCPNINGVTLVYDGVIGGTSYPKQGGGSNHLCMPLDPEYTSSLQYQHGVQGYSMVYPSEYETGYLGDKNQNARCAVCSISTRTLALMIPGKTSCPTGWTREYYGYLMSEHSENYRSSFICVDRNHAYVANTGDHTEASDLWQTEADCSLYSCPPYDAEKELPCVVCST